jgi:ubiquinone/menaquinone biosynthesis C-methylase UbiE
LAAGLQAETISSMKIQEAYNEWSHTYDSDDNATRDLDQVAIRRVLGKLYFKSIIEVGCGTGKNTELLARIGGSVQALDFSAGMLARARKKLGRLPNVSFSAADITKRWPCARQSANLVTCNLVLEHIQELSPVFSEAARALAKGGCLFISELHPFRQYQGIVAKYRRGRQTTRIPAFVHHLSDFLEPARNSGLVLKALQEWWHEKDEGKPPRLVTLLFERAGQKEKRL